MTAAHGTGRPAHVIVCGPDPAEQARYLFARVVAVVGYGGLYDIVCELEGAMDLGVVDAIARMQLATRRCGVRFWLRCSDDDFRGLLALAGLTAFLPVL
jgi:hypothetical protein